MAETLNKYELKRLFHYNPITGNMMWVRPHGTTARAGTVIKAVNGKGYRHVRVRGQQYLVHRLAFLWMTGKFPVGEADHVNGDKSDNRWCNLRDTTHAENCKNQIKPKHNTSGAVGVYRSEKRGKWQAQIKVNYENIYLGVFDDWFDAVCARKSAELKYGFHLNHGRTQQRGSKQ